MPEEKKETFIKRFLTFAKQETVLVISLLLACFSMLLVHPDGQYLSYIDWNSLALLFCLMAVMAAYKETGLFHAIGNKLLRKVKTTRQLFLLLVLLPFIFSMFITNDVALITFVPFAIIVLSISEKETLLIPVIVMQTIAANLGSMLLPMGNPQNLYLYAKSGISFGQFVSILLPYSAAALIGIFFSSFTIQKRAIVIACEPKATPLPKKEILLYTVAFILCLLNVAKLLDIRLLFVCILLFFLLVSRKTLLLVDYSLLGTFLGFFIFIGNMERLPAFQNFIASILSGRETILAIAASQIISNVPAALLLSGFTSDATALIIGCNLGGLGTLIASMASLISYKQLAREYPSKKGRYLLWFTLANIIFLVLLLLLHSQL